jgi:hypothetical protein
VHRLGISNKIIFLRITGITNKIRSDYPTIIPGFLITTKTIGKYSEIEISNTIGTSDTALISYQNGTFPEKPLLYAQQLGRYAFRNMDPLR